MAKKCIPGVICVENMTLFLLFIIGLLISYLYYITNVKNMSKDGSSKIIVVNSPPYNPLASITTRLDPFNDPYSPPMKTDGIIHPRNMADIRGVPVNIRTQGYPSDYQQIGILNRGHNSDMILPLMGRRTLSGRDKWQYYTISNTGNVNTKLPVSLKGRSCTNEYGCDNINNGDVVYVEGYNDTFRATVYENNTFEYIPYL
jgi:hypothetical protein